MKLFSLTLLLSVLFGWNCYGQRSRHVVLITIDGFRPEFYLEPSWGMVNLRQMKENGVCATSVDGVFPTVTFVNHTSIITGEKSAKHGILYNAPFKPKGERSEWYWFYDAIKVPTLWDAAKNNDLTTAAVNWPVSVGGPIDHNIPIIKMKGKDRLEVIKKYSTPAGLFEEVQQNATGTLEPEDFMVRKNYLAMDANVGRISAYIIRKYKPSLMTIRLSAVDHFQHKYGRDGKMVKAAVAGADRAIRDIIEALDRAGIRENTTVLVTGDHGFVDTHTAIAPNIWLKEEGLLGEKGDWKAQFHTVGGSAFLMLKDPDDTGSLRQVRDILQKRPPGEKKLYQFIERKELDSLGVDSRPSFGLKALPGVVFKNSIEGEVIRPHRLGTHGYYPDTPGIKTGFVGFGAGMRNGLRVDRMGLEDIAPLIAELLGMEWRSEGGVLLKGMLNK